MIKKIIIVIGGLVLIAGLVFATQGFLKERRTITISNDSNEITNSLGEINILILGKVGAGQGGQWHAAPDLVDTILLVNFKPEEKIANLISLPRDLYGDFGDAPIRLNRIVHNDRVSDLLSLMPEIAGVEVNKYVVIDLDTLSAIVDGLGGIDIDLQEPVTDSVGGFTLQAGEQRLGGDEAVWLIRNRFAPEGDFFREKNQHLVVTAMFDKFNSLSSIGKTAFAFRMLPYISKSETNFDAGILLAQLKSLKDIRFNSIVLDFGTKLLDSSTIAVEGGDAYILVPKEGINKYTRIKEFIQKSIL